MNLTADDVVAVDIETYSTVPISYGTPVYSTGAELLLFAWSVNGGPVKLWDVTVSPMLPWELYQILTSPCKLLAHNAAFEAWMLGALLPYLTIDPARWRCSMVRAFSHSLPGKLDQLCAVMGVPQEKAKIKDGHSLVLLFCKPLAKKRKLRRATRETHPEEWERFKEYCVMDVVAMMECCRRMPAWNNTAEELRYFQLDQQINRRGVTIDIEFVKAALVAIEREKKVLSNETQELTDNYLNSTSQRDRLVSYLSEMYDIKLDNLRGETVARLLDQAADLPPEAVQLLNNRAMTSKTSSAKYQRILNSTSADKQLRYLLQFAGAMRTARWAGRGPQFHNLPRPDKAHTAEKLETFINAVKQGAAHLVYQDLMNWMSSAIRGVIVAPPGHKLVVVDLSNIEGRSQAYLAGEDWKLKAFFDFDAGIGPDLYLASYARTFGVSIEEAKRQVGKVLELSMGYGGGVNAFVTFADVYRLDLNELVASVRDNLPANLMSEANKLYAWLTKQNKQPVGVDKDTWLVCDCLKRLWREAHPAIVAYWEQIEDAMLTALANPGVDVPCRMLTMRFEHNWMRVKLPSGRSLSYPSFEYHDNQFRYRGHDLARRWVWIKSFGGKFFENFCQAFARDLMAHNMPRMEEAGYMLGLTVHDEDLTVTPDRPEFNAAQASEIMASAVPWAPGMPLAAAGHEMYRYAKMD